MTSARDVRLNDDNAPRRRPGPFGPASALLPADQQVLTIRDNTIAADALERMVDSGFSQLPVTNSAGQIIGVFSWQSFGRRVSELHVANVNVATLAVKDTELEKVRFIDPDTYIDTETDWSEIDYVIVGNKDNLLGVLSISDVFGRLNDFAEAFVLLFEIEHEIRDVIQDVYTSEELTKVFEKIAMGDSWPARQAAETLGRILDKDPPMVTGKKNIEAANFAMHYIQEGVQSRPIAELKDFTFAQYRVVIFNKDNWPRFEEVFDTPREILNTDFEKINELRNIVFHFRRGITPKDTDRLRRFRDKLRYNRELYAKQQNAESITTRT